MEINIEHNVAKRTYTLFAEINQGQLGQRAGEVLFRKAVDGMAEKLIENFLEEYKEDLLKVISPQVLIPAIQNKVAEILTNKYKETNGQTNSDY